MPPGSDLHLFPGLPALLILPIAAFPLLSSRPLTDLNEAPLAADLPGMYPPPLLPLPPRRIAEHSALLLWPTELLPPKSLPWKSARDAVIACDQKANGSSACTYKEMVPSHDKE